MVSNNVQCLCRTKKTMCKDDEGWEGGVQLKYVIPTKSMLVMLVMLVTYCHSLVGLVHVLDVLDVLDCLYHQSHPISPMHLLFSLCVCILGS